MYIGNIQLLHFDKQYEVASQLLVLSASKHNYRRCCGARTRHGFRHVKLIVVILMYLFFNIIFFFRSLITVIVNYKKITTNK